MERETPAHPGGGDTCHAKPEERGKMEMKTMILVIMLWEACGVIGAGFYFAYFQGKYQYLAAEDRHSDLGQALFMGILFGPIWLLSCFFCCGFGEYGWRLK